MDMTEPERTGAAGGGLPLIFPANDEETTASSSLSPPVKAPPPRLRRRLLMEPKTPPSAEDIAAKFREADLRRQAKRQRGEHLRHRRHLNSNLCSNSKMVHEQDFLSRKLARCWKVFKEQRKTTLSLAKSYVSLEINEEYVKSLPFEQFAILIKSGKTINTLKALADRLECRLRISHATMGIPARIENIDHLLTLVVSPNHMPNSSNSKKKKATTTQHTKEEAQARAKLLRYPVRVVLCAYMIVGHPDEVLNGKSECEISLSESAASFIREFELLTKIAIDGPIRTSQEQVASGISSQRTFRSQLEAFDKAWCKYLHHLATWKLRDAKLLEEDLLRAACQLELSMMQINDTGDNGNLAQDMEAIKKKVLDDQKLLREQLQQLSGKAGLERLECVLADVQLKFIGGVVPGSSSLFSIPQMPHSFSPGSLKGSPGINPVETRNTQGSSRIVNSSYGVDDSCAGKVTGSSSLNNTHHQNSYVAFPSENELLVNEIVHENSHGFADSLNAMDNDEDSLKGKVKKTMEKAFWDGVAKSIEQDDPDFSWLLKLMEEVRDELCEMSPQTWRQEIVETIDVDILSQMLRSGTSDMDYLGKILEYALITLQKLTAPANDEEMKSSHNKLLKELQEMSNAGDKSNSSFSLLIKGLRFVLREIQAVNREICKARLRLVKPFIKGPAGLEYLKKAFANRYGPPSSSLTLTREWLSSLHPVADEEWDEYNGSLSALGSSITGSSLPTALRTGGTNPVVSRIGSQVPGSEQPECKGDKIDLLVRLTLLRLVGLNLDKDTMPETLQLNISRLRAVQSQVQKIIVISTSMLILRQMLLSEKLVSSSSDMGNIVSECCKQLFELLEKVKDVDTSKIVSTVSSFLKDSSLGHDAGKLKAKEEIMKSMLRKSLQAGNPIYMHVSGCVYQALRGAVLGGTGHKGKQLVAAALQRVGGTPITADRVMEAAEVLIVVASVSCNVHRCWYEELLKSM